LLSKKGEGVLVQGDWMRRVVERKVVGCPLPVVCAVAWSTESYENAAMEPPKAAKDL
jgi:hypothetical protein